jgi:hypothetical protein
VIRFFLAFLALSAPAAAQQVAPKPVVLERLVFDGKPADYAGAWARIVGLKAGGDGFVSVRAAPSTAAAELDRLTKGRNIYAINPQDDWKKATFIGVIYSADPEMNAEAFETACGVDNPPKPNAPVKRNYTGPCKSGWVHKRFIEVLAD